MYPQTDPPRAPKDYLPTMYDLPSEDPEEPGVPDEFHIYQPQLLRETFHPPNYSPDDVFTGSDLNLYYDVRHPLWHKRPDWFAVVGIPRLYENRDLRLSYVFWQEGVRPLIAVELLSPGTEREDLGQTVRELRQPPSKWDVYEQILGIPYYVVFDRYTDNLRAFQLQGSAYQNVDLADGPLWLPDIQLGLGLWQGRYHKIERLWLRWQDEQGNWLLTDAEAEHQRADAERDRADQLEAELRALRREMPPSN